MKVMGRAQGAPGWGHQAVLAGGGWVRQAFQATAECAWHCRLGAALGVGRKRQEKSFGL